MELDELNKGNVTFVDHLKVSTKEKCMILIQMKDDSHQFIGDIYYITTVIKQYIRFVTIIENKNFKIKMKDCTLTLFDDHGAMIVKVTMRKNKMFLPNIETNVPKSMCEK
jgi:hypothetical protein